MQNIFSAIDNALSENSRVLLAIAGPPAAGKSTISDQLIAHYGEDAVVVPMDGFHLDNAILDAKNLRSRKGSAPSFDADGFVSLVKRIAGGEHVYAPVFDRANDVSRAGAIEVDQQKLIIFEGNYLLYDEAPWRALRQFWTYSIWLNVSLEEVEKRCVQRWLDHGFDLETAQKRASANDLKNAEDVFSKRLPANIEF